MGELLDDDGDPACDITGSCKPFEGEEGDDWAMCQHCGGWRKRDYPHFGNWGIPESDFAGREALALSVGDEK